MRVMSRACLTMKKACIDMAKPKLNARHIEIAKQMTEMPKRCLFTMQWQNYYGFGVGNFISLRDAGLVVDVDVGDPWGRKKYCVSQNAKEILQANEADTIEQLSKGRR